MIYIWTFVLSLMPISELRGSIPYALINNIPFYIASPFAIAVNALAAPLCWLFLSTVHRFLYGSILKDKDSTDGITIQGGFLFYRTLFDRFVERARQKLKGGVDKWGALGVALFVAIPLPMTGAWTGTLGAWVLGLSKRKTFLAVILGVIIAGTVVTLVMLLGLSAFRLFLKT